MQPQIHSHLNRATEIQMHTSLALVLALAVGIGAFTFGICRKEPIVRLACSAISFTSLISAAVSRKVVRINQNYRQKANDILEQNDTDSIYQETRLMLNNPNAPERIHNLRSANSPFENEVYLGW